MRSRFRVDCCCERGASSLSEIARRDCFFFSGLYFSFFKHRREIAIGTQPTRDLEKVFIYARDGGESAATTSAGAVGSMTIGEGRVESAFVNLRTLALTRIVFSTKDLDDFTFANVLIASFSLFKTAKTCARSCARAKV